MVGIGRQVGLPTRAVLTAMDAPLGRAVGNALEVEEAVAILKGAGPADVATLSATLATHMLVAAGVASDEAAGDALVSDAIRSGRALDVFRAAVARQGGDPAVIDDTTRLAATPTRGRVAATRSGFVTAIDAASVGRASMMLGAGRERLDTPIHHGAGVTVEAQVGSPVQAGATLATLHVGRPERREEARALVAAAFEIEDAPPPASPLVYDVVA